MAPILGLFKDFIFVDEVAFNSNELKTYGYEKRNTPLIVRSRVKSEYFTLIVAIDA